MCRRCTLFCSPDEFHRLFFLVVKEILAQTLAVWYIYPHLVKIMVDLGKYTYKTLSVSASM